MVYSAPLDCHPIEEQEHSPAPVREITTASWYGRFFQGRETANGERFNMHSNTAAHPTLPFGTVIKVTNTMNGRYTYARINDRGPYKKMRGLDLSLKCARDIGMVGAGLATVVIEIPGAHTL